MSLRAGGRPSGGKSGGKSSGKSGKSHGVANAINTLNMDQAGLGRFLKSHQERYGKDESARRRHVRWPYPVATLRVEFSHPGGSDTKLILACRNLSAGGIGLLHRNYVHKGTRCRVYLVDVHGDEVEVQGTVVRAGHMEGAVHEIGVQFDAELDARRFLRLDPFDDGFSLEKVNPQTLKGTVLYVEDSPLDQALVQHYLRGTQVVLHVAATLEDALKKAEEQQLDLILCDFDLGDYTGVELIGCLREKGISTPIIILTADTSVVMKKMMSRVQADAFVAKPLKPETLYRAIAEYMSMGSGSMQTSLPPGHASLSLLPTFVQQVRDYAKSLDKAITAKSLSRCRSLCLQIAGAAPVMGFDKLASMAKAAEASLAGTMSVQESIGPLKMLMTACLQVSARAPEESEAA